MLVSVVNDYPLVVAGVQHLLQPFGERVALTAGPRQRPDVVLYDTFGRAQGPTMRVGELLTRTRSRHLAVYSWNLSEPLVRASFEAGASGYLFKGLPAEQLVEALERVSAGTQVSPQPSSRTKAPSGADWPGRAQGLSVREAEIVALITRGLTNEEIAEQTFLSINSVKTYIRTAYRKMGVTRRPQAVLWGVQHHMTASLGGDEPES
ncbi:response regulator transcription factor [Nocardioides flavescens]|uniref:response regulator transcription factor n=1 Tax=Nocardioides flavescens TaxID=2691959 RepID=UPI00301DB433